MRIGNPEQTVRVLISTASQATWVVLPDSGWPNDQERGGVFNSSQSKSWKEIGLYSLGLESNLYTDTPNASYGLDTVALGSFPSTGGPKLTSQVVAGFLPIDYFTGMFGLGVQPTNFSTTNSQPSFLSTMKTKGLIPSLTWSYTAGASYRE